MSRLTSIAIITASLLVSASITIKVMAKPAPWYEVEVFVFEHPSQTKEHWSDEIVLPKVQGTVDFITPAITTELSVSNLGLSDGQVPLCDANDWGMQTSQANTALASQDYGANTHLDSTIASDPSFETVAPSTEGVDYAIESEGTQESIPCREQFAQTQASRLQEVPFSIAANIEKQAIWGTQNQLLAESQGQFDNIIKKINREPGTKPLLHMTWQQVMLPRHRAKAVRLFAGKDLSDRFHIDGSPITHSQQDLLSQFGFLQDYFTPKKDHPVWKVDGLFNIYLNHYLYVETQLNYRDEGVKTIDSVTENGVELSVQDSSQEQGLNRPNVEEKMLPEVTAQEQAFLYAIPMVQNRRVRSSEIHYLDHPKLGIIFQIRKMPQPEEEVIPIELPPVDEAQMNTVSE